MGKKICLLVALLSLLASFAPAQTITGSITGTVSDPSGASVPGGNVTAINTETNVHSTASTNSDGIYTFPWSAEVTGWPAYLNHHAYTVNRL